MKKPKYFPNNWEAYKDSPDELFISLPFDEFMNWKIGGYEIPSSIACIIRAKNVDTGKVKEYVYRKTHAAKMKCRQLMDSGNTEFIVAQQDTVHFITPEDANEII
tara:strand:+ start:282 stop:596 length:315 start_codon:yes stop_codon:yes gene_type:complete